MATRVQLCDQQPPQGHYAGVHGSTCSRAKPEVHLAREVQLHLFSKRPATPQEVVRSMQEPVRPMQEPVQRLARTLAQATPSYALGDVQ